MQKAIDRLEDMLRLYEDLRTKSQHDDLSDLKKESITFNLRTTQAIRDLTWPDSSIRRALDDLTNGGANAAHNKYLVGYLEALRDEYASGYAQSFAELLHASVFTDVIEMGEELLVAGYIAAAAVTLRVALESHLRALAEKHGVPTTKTNGKNEKAESLNQNLCKADAYNTMQQKQVTAWLAIGNEAAHGNDDKYDEADVKRLVTGVPEFIARFPA